MVDEENEVSSGKTFSIGKFVYKVTDEKSNHVEAVGYKGKGGDVGIPHIVNKDKKSYHVTSIKQGTFKNNNPLTRVASGIYLESIGDNCFKDCLRLEEVSLSEGLKGICNEAFMNCALLQILECLVHPISLNPVGDLNDPIFMYCESTDTIILTPGTGHGCDVVNAFFAPWGNGNGISPKTITISEGVKSIGDTAFMDCRRIVDITLPNSLEKVGERAFAFLV